MIKLFLSLPTERIPFQGFERIRPFSQKKRLGWLIIRIKKKLSPIPRHPPSFHYVRISSRYVKR